MTTYVIDTSTWISLAEHHVLGKSIFIPFWDALVDLAQAGTIVSPDEVLVELKAKDDAIYKWVRDHKRHLIKSPDRDVQSIFKEIIGRYPELTTKGKPQAKSDGDAWVIALAKRLGAGATVVSDETDVLSKPTQKIPGVCRLMGIRPLTTIEFIDEALT